MDNVMLGLADRMDGQLHLLVSHLKVGLSQSQCQSGIGRGQIFLLHLLSFKGPSRVCDLSRLLGVTPAAVTGLAGNLLSRDLVTRRRGEQDRREVLLEITDAGRHLIEQLKEARQQRLAELLDTLGEPDACRLTELLERLAATVECREMR